MKRTDTVGTILWFTGWSMPRTVFGSLQVLLPDYKHVSFEYGEVESDEELLALAEAQARSIREAAMEGAALYNGTYRPLLIGGWSLGGLLALHLAVNGLADGLILMGATARFIREREESERGWPDVYVRQMILMLGKDRQAVEESFRHRLLTAEGSKKELVVKLSPIGSWSTAALIAGLQLLRSTEYLSRLPGIHCPVLLIHGTKDTICPYGAAEEMAALLPHVELLTIAECGHMPFHGREESMAAEIRRWWHGCKSKLDQPSI
ncbi:alpha/beta hydrolase [Paenibacillus alkaliterrae]|uniref:alpha/beta hydrolase n=1 Tax=Paenibacillus alkaliterrae TaxID=320909 RepID=UPI001F2BC621|nr:alpha/beta hydrolase [Paenibacillus alkaliterrae]MCF2938077.1 alpha/beta hydrolase [Paenibacillus alkaliterrae]